MYFKLFLIICACTFMYRVAEYERKKGWLWGLFTCMLCVVLLQLTSSDVLMFLGAVLTSYFTMMIIKMYASKG